MKATHCLANTWLSACVTPMGGKNKTMQKIEHTKGELNVTIKSMFCLFLIDATTSRNGQ